MQTTKNFLCEKIERDVNSHSGRMDGKRDGIDRDGQSYLFNEREGVTQFCFHMETASGLYAQNKEKDETLTLDVDD